MRNHEFDADCPCCRPAMLDTETMQPLPENHLAMLVAKAVWDDMPYEDKFALDCIWTHSSRDPEHLAVAEKFRRKFIEKMAVATSQER